MNKKILMILGIIIIINSLLLLCFPRIKFSNNNFLKIISKISIQDIQNNTMNNI